MNVIKDKRSGVPAQFKMLSIGLVLLFFLLEPLNWQGQDVARAETSPRLPTPFDMSGLVTATTLPAASPNPDKVYFPNYGQFVANPLLRFWRVNGKYQSFGGPMARVGRDSEGHTVQYFEKMALAYYPELAGTTWEIRPYDIGRKYLETLTGAVQQDFPYAPVAPVSNTSTRHYFPQTGHTLSAGFFTLYNRSGGLFIWGYPLSEEYSKTLSDGKVYTVQLFERGRMAWRADIGPVIDPHFGTNMANLLGANTAVELNEGQAPDYSTWDWEHWVDINLSRQNETFYEGDIPVRTNLVTTGKPGNATPTGTYHIIRRVYNEHMVGGSIGAGDYYDLYDVLYTQYFTGQGHALHYAWWRSVFGVTGSHGCVNQDYDSSLFAWNWLTIGSRVSIHY
ncbi:MAG: L,D-transpeptidase [Chloroflexi bacterium]|nr:L,D-transpeptidase [Chloroflexota bacterium]OJW01841.1 MAG: hypothetical protein BGO39_28225 [Chloroflexi bacterium 54-19]